MLDFITNLSIFIANKVVIKRLINIYRWLSIRILFINGLNFFFYILFIINNSFFIVDLPGYGFAKVSKKEKEKIKNLHENYFKNRKQLFSALLLIDIRLKPQQIDLEFMKYLNEFFVPFILIFTKCDKLKKREIDEKIKTYSKEIKKNWEVSPQIITSSSKNKNGLEDILEFIDNSSKEFKLN